MMRPYVPCTRCQGSGQMRMPRTAHEALLNVPAKTTRSSADIAFALGIKHTAACNRLSWLERHGFVQRVGARLRAGGTRWSRVGSQPVEPKTGGADG